MPVRLPWFFVTFSNISHSRLVQFFKEKLIGVHYVYHYGSKNKESFCEALIGELQNSALLISPNWVNNTDDFNEFIIRCKKKGIKLLFSKDFHWNFLLMIKILFSALSKLHYVSLNGNRVATLRMTFLAIHTFINETVNLSNFSASYVLTYEDQFLGHIIKKNV